MTAHPPSILLPKEQALIPPGHSWGHLSALGFGLGAVGLAAALLLSRSAPERFYLSWLVAFAYFLTIALGCLYFILIHAAMQGGWGIVVRRLAENAAATIPLFAVLFLPLVLGMQALFPWSRPGAAAADHLIQWKAPYLNAGFFYARSALYFLVWSAIAWWFVRLSYRQDDTRDDAIAVRLRRYSGALLIPLGLTHTFAAVDWMMSLDPHWYSTIFGVYSFSGSLVAGFAFVAAVVTAMRWAGLLSEAITEEHLHDLGKLIFAFTVFWAYIAFSQYFLIWYGNLPEETSWFKHRLEGGWLAVSVALAIGHFAIPFFFLMPRSMKRNPATLFAGAVWMLLMHLLDVYWMVAPAIDQHAPHFGLVDVAALVAVGGIFLGAFGWLLRRHALVPIGDPRLAESLSFENE